MSPQPLDQAVIPDAPPAPVHSLRFVLASEYDDIEPRLGGFTDSLFSRRNGKNYLVVDRGDPNFVSPHAVVSDCLDALKQVGVEVVALEVYDIDDIITTSYYQACEIAQRWVEDQMDSLEPHSKIKLVIERYEMHIDEYLEAYSCRG